MIIFCDCLSFTHAAFRDEYIYGEICGKEILTGSAFKWTTRMHDSPPILQWKFEKEQLKQKDQLMQQQLEAEMKAATEPQ